MQIISPNHQRPVAWKNGHGVTREIAQCPTSQPYDWRLSLAEMDRNAEFSTFPGLRRILTVVAGQGMGFATPSEESAVKPNEPVVFEGDLAIEATLTDGPVCNYNLIYNPERIRADVQVVTGRQNLMVPTNPGRIVVLYVIQGSATFDTAPVAAGDTAISTEIAGTPCAMHTGIGLLFTLDKI